MNVLSDARKRAAAFTLIELLIVVAIGVILSALAIISVGGINADAVASAASTIQGNANLTRSTAILNDTIARLCIISSASDTTENYRYFSIQKWDPTALDGSGGWTQVGKWQALPVGVVFDPNPSVNGISVFQSPNLSDTVSFRGSAAQISFLEFNSRGAAASQSPLVTLRVINGVPSRGAAGNSPANWAEVVVDNVVGKIQLVRP